MTLGDKLRTLRELEGGLRGLGRALTQAEMSRLMRSELGRGLSQSHLSQIEGGARPHLTNPTRKLLARFFRVHPGYLVDDPAGFHNELASPAGAGRDPLAAWLRAGAERFRRDPALGDALTALAATSQPRRALLLLAAILENTGLDEQLHQVLECPPVKVSR